MSKEMWTKAGEAMVAAGAIPLPVGDTMLELIQLLMTEEEAEFIQLFDKTKTIDEIKEVTTIDDDGLEKILDSLMHKGVVVGVPSRRTGQVIYKLQPPLPGVFEYTMMKGETSPKDVRLAELFDQLFKEMAKLVDENYDTVMELYRSTKPFTRVVPVDHDVVEEAGDTVIPHEKMDDIIDKFDTIALVTCYCRHKKELLGESCKVTDNKDNCLLFGKAARFAIDYKFGHEISADEAKKIVKDSIEDGLVHKSFHNHSDIEKDEYAICNCCKCCCGTIEKYHKGSSPSYVYASHLAKVDEEECISCEECVDRCPMEAIAMEDIAVIDTEKCFGCGVCAVKCPTEAISLERIGMREIFLPPKRQTA